MAKNTEFSEIDPQEVYDLMKDGYPRTIDQIINYLKGHRNLELDENNKIPIKNRIRYIIQKNECIKKLENEEAKKTVKSLYKKGIETDLYKEFFSERKSWKRNRGTPKDFFIFKGVNINSEILNDINEIKKNVATILSSKYEDLYKEYLPSQVLTGEKSSLIRYSEEKFPIFVFVPENRRNTLIRVEKTSNLYNYKFHVHQKLKVFRDELMKARCFNVSDELWNTLIKTLYIGRIYSEMHDCVPLLLMLNFLLDTFEKANENDISLYNLVNNIDNRKKLLKKIEFIYEDLLKYIRGIEENYINNFLIPWYKNNKHFSRMHPIIDLNYKDLSSYMHSREDSIKEMKDLQKNKLEPPIHPFFDNMHQHYVEVFKKLYLLLYYLRDENLDKKFLEIGNTPEIIIPFELNVDSPPLYALESLIKNKEKYNYFKNYIMEQARKNNSQEFTDLFYKLNEDLSNSTLRVLNKFLEILPIIPISDIQKDISENSNDNNIYFRNMYILQVIPSFMKKYNLGKDLNIF